MSSAAKLPQDLLEAVFEHLIDPFPSFDDADIPTLFSADLASAALVCRAWRDPAQSALFRDTLIPQNAADDFINSAARTRHPTRSLAISALSLNWRNDEVDVPSFGPLLSTCKDLEHLWLGEPEDTPLVNWQGELQGESLPDWGFLRTPSLANLRKLSIVWPSRYAAPTGNITSPFPFQLTSVAVSFEDATSSHTSLIGKLRDQSTIRNLHIRILSGESSAEISVLLNALGPGLRHLHLECPASIAGFFDLGPMRNLDHITLRLFTSEITPPTGPGVVTPSQSALDTILSSLPLHTLHHLTVDTSVNLKSLADLMMLQALARLAILEIVSLDRDTARSRRGPDEAKRTTSIPEFPAGWLQGFSKRGVRVVFSK